MINKIAGYRRMLGLSQKQLSRQLGISVTSYFNKEHGKTPFSDQEKIFIRDELRKVIPTIRIDDIFFD